MNGNYIFIAISFFLYINFVRRQARTALKLKVQSAFEEAFELKERLAQQNEEKMKQRALCEQLANQVRLINHFIHLVHSLSRRYKNGVKNNWKFLK